MSVVAGRSGGVVSLNGIAAVSSSWWPFLPSRQGVASLSGKILPLGSWQCVGFFVFFGDASTTWCFYFDRKVSHRFWGVFHPQ